MSRLKKTTAKKATSKAKTTTTRGKNKATTKEEMSSSLKSQTASIKLLKGTATKRPPNNPDVPQNIIDTLNTDFNSIMELLDVYYGSGDPVVRKNRSSPFSV